jgi:cell division protein FtsL
MVSALSLVYVTYQSRSLHIALQTDTIQRNQMHVEWEQLLLEKGTWSTQARVQTLAENKLGMVMPDAHSLVALKG